MHYGSAICLLCRAATRSPTSLCSPCRAELTASPEQVCRCGLPSTLAPSALCGSCLGQPPPYSALHSAYLYGYPLDQLLSRFKYNRELALEQALAQLWLARAPVAAVDALVPVPLHWQRYFWRGFNQSARLGQRLARARQIPFLQALKRARAAPTQQGLSAAARKRNLRGAFAVCKPVAGLRLALIDDVVTTTATARSACQCLLDGGAVEVQVWSLCRAL